MSLGNARNVHHVAGGKHVALNLGADFVGVGILEFFKVFLGFNSGFVEHAFLRLVDKRFLSVLERHDGSSVAVALDGLVSDYGHRTCFDDGDRNHKTGFVENLSHAEFFT